MAFAESKPKDSYPWLSWAMTGVFTLAGILLTGLLISARNPPPQQAALPKDAPRSEEPGSSPAKPAKSSAHVDSAPWQIDAKPPRETISAVPKAPPPKISPPKAPPSIAAKPLPPPVPSAVPAVAVDQPVAPRSSPPPAQAVETPGRESPQPQATKPAAPPDAAKTAAYKKAVAEVRRLMAVRNIAESKKRLKVASDNVQTPVEDAEVERLETIQDHLEQFWDGIRGAVSAMQPTNEIVLSETERVAVIDSSRKELAVQMYGGQQRYRIEAIPMPLLSAIAKSSFKLTPGTKLVVGSFLAMDAHGSRAEARKLWQEAIKAGEADGKLLLPELDVPIQKAR